MIRSVIAATALAAVLAAPVSSRAGEPMTEQQAKEIAVDAYVYGYSLVTTEITRVQSSNVPKTEGLHAPLNVFANAKPTRRRTIAACPPQMLTRCTRWRGLTWPSRRCSAIPTWASVLSLRDDGLVDDRL